MKYTLAILILIIFFSNCRRKTTEYLDVASIDVVANKVDSSLNPADDFFDWANGAWFKAFPMPPNVSIWGIETFVNDEIFHNTIQVCRNAAVNPNPESAVEQIIGSLWATGMDTTALDVLGIKPLSDEWAKLNRIKTSTELWEAVGVLQTYQTQPLFYCYVYQDRFRSNRYAYYLKQGGLGLPSREYYLSKDPNTLKIKEAYRQYVKTLFTYTNESPHLAQLRADIVLKFESFLAEKHSRLEEIKGPYKTYNKLSIKDLERISPSVEWRVLFNSIGVKIDTVIVGQPHYIRQFENTLLNFSLEEWKTYLKFCLLNKYAAYMGRSFRMAHFEFYEKILEGKKQPTPHWKKVLGDIESVVGEGVGQLVVKDFFPEKNKKRYSDMVENIRDAYAQQITDCSWMSAATKKIALEKLKRMNKKVGYPDEWTNFGTMPINRESYLKNMMYAKRWRFANEMAKLTRQVDRNTWNISPQEYNAYYSLANNEIVISASMLMLPGYDDDQIDDAIAYGYMGASIIGHEMTHGFDLDGKEYDINGNLNRWWSSKDSAEFAAKASILSKQYSSYLVVDSIYCRGDATLDENIADLNGVVIALNAFKKTKQYNDGKKIAGYTPLQRFFMGYALGWMNKYTKERLVKKVLTDIHSPPKLRVNGVLPNIPEFYEAFNVKPANKMWKDPRQRVKIW